MPAPAADAWRADLRDQMDIDAGCAAEHPCCGAAAAQPVQQAPGGAPAGGAKHQLGRVDATGELQQRIGRILTGDQVIAAAEILDKLPLRLEGLR